MSSEPEDDVTDVAVVADAAYESGHDAGYQQGYGTAHDEVRAARVLYRSRTTRLSVLGDCMVALRECYDGSDSDLLETMTTLCRAMTAIANDDIHGEG